MPSMLGVCIAIDLLLKQLTDEETIDSLARKRLPLVKGYNRRVPPPR